MLYTDQTAPITARRSILDRRFGVGRLSSEILLYGLVFLLSIGLHLWQLDVKAMHHDESIHAWMSYKFFTGRGPFSCADLNPADDVPAPQAATYCYDPVYHGPTLYFATLLSYFLFGVGDAQARLPMALAGIGLVPMAWTLRSFIGRRGALLAALLMTISPSLLYYTRFARHDALVLLWSLFMVVGLWKFVRDGGAANLALAAAGLALTWATHELVFILIFIGGSFLGLRLLWELRPRLFWVAAALSIGVGIGVTAASLAVSQALQPMLYGWLQRLLGPSLMLGVGALVIAPMAAVWDRQPVVSQRFALTWRFERGIYGVALATFLVIFTLLFTTFFAYPLGFFDGWYQGIAYWLLSQHEFARGGQPWFYYLMLLPIYDLLALVFGLLGLGWLLAGGIRALIQRRASQPSKEDSSTGEDGAIGQHGGDGNGAVQHAGEATRGNPPLFVYFLGFWFVEALVGFSWAGEKMPWLLTHISLPATLLAAWALGQMIRRVPWRELRYDWGWTVPLLTLVLVIAVLVAASTLSGGDDTVTGIQTRLRGLVPIAFAGLCVFGLLTVANRFGGRVVLRLAGLSCAAVLLLYGLRAMTLVVFRHPDTPVEPLVYTQTAPDVPILVRQIKQLAINETRNQRTADDPTGGYSLAITLDGGASKHGGEGSLAWPMQWYLRDFENGSVRWLDVDGNTSLDGNPAIVVLYKPHATPQLRDQLADEYVETAEGVFNWWFPEFTGTAAGQGTGQTVRGYKSLGAEGPWAVLSWPFRPANWGVLSRYMLYRELPLELEGREMVVFMRRDVVPGGVAAQASDVPVDTLAAEAVLGTGLLNNPRGITVSADGTVYIADTGNHRIVAIGADGQQQATFGSLGNGDGQLNEPSGVAVDEAGNVYVADTWNSRVVKFAPDGRFIAAWGSGTTQFGDPFLDPQTGASVQRLATDNGGDPAANAANPLGFFGPRNVLVRDGRVYIADTGNARVVVTDTDGNVVQQFGGRGPAPGLMQEPIGLGMDEQGQLYVGDTWNGRVQVFRTGADGLVETVPVAEFAVRGWTANSYNDPYLAVAPDGRVWASQGARNSLAEYNADHQLVRRIKGEPEYSAPKGVAVGPAGDLYVANSGAREIARLSLR